MATAGKRHASHIASCGFVYRKRDPRWLFFDIKDETYGQIPFRNHFCPVGGNWVGRGAKQDHGPRETFVREVEEELSFDRPVISGEELYLMGYDPRNIASYIVPKLRIAPGEIDKQALGQLKQAVIDAVVPWRDYFLTVPDWVFRQADPETTKGTTYAVCSYFAVGLDEDAWQLLYHLQARFGNLSCESYSTILTVEQMTHLNLMGVSAHDQVLRDFLYEKGIVEADHLPIHAGPTAEPLGNVLASYDEYIARYDLTNIPSQQFAD